MATQQDIDLVQEFTKVMTSDDIEGVIRLFAPDCEWKIMATGETFQGLDGVRQIATRSVAARNHNQGQGLIPFNVFTNAEGTKLIWEYVHTGIVTDQWPASTHIVPQGTRFELPIILSCDLRDNKIITIREYFDLLTLIEPDSAHHLYS